jgi:hypothetical protein
MRTDQKKGCRLTALLFLCYDAKNLLAVRRYAVPATRYKIWSIGAPVGSGATQSFHVGVAGVAKGNSPGLPFVVANELLCGHLARVLLLPVPPGFIIEHNGTPHYVSLNFNLAGEDLPPADPGAIQSAHPDLACGIVLFDIWIVNADRHRQNIAHDRTTDRVQIFDHSHAFFGNGAAHLTATEDQLGIGGHCLAGELRSLTGMRSWRDRILSVPEFYIRAVVEAAAEVGLPADQIGFCASYLLRRRSKLLDLVKQYRASFPKVEQRLWDELDTTGEAA